MLRRFVYANAQTHRASRPNEIAAFHGDNPMCLWVATTGKLLHRRAVGHTFAFSGDGTILVTGSGQSIRFWQTVKS